MPNIAMLALILAASWRVSPWAILESTAGLSSQSFYLIDAFGKSLLGTGGQFFANFEILSRNRQPPCFGCIAKNIPGESEQRLRVCSVSEDLPGFSRRKRTQTHLSGSINRSIHKNDTTRS